MKLNFGDLKMWLATLVPFIVSGIIFQSGTLRQIKEMSKLKNDLRFSNVEFVTAKDKANELARLKIELSESESKTNEYKDRLLNSNETPEFLNILSKIADECGIEFINISPQIVKDAGFYMTMPVKLEFESSYPNFLKYIFKIEQLPGLMKVDNLDSNSTAESKLIKVTLLAVFFINKGEGFTREVVLNELPLKEYPRLETSPFLYTEKRAQGEIPLSLTKGLELTAIVSGEVYACIINGQACHVGDEMAGCRIVEIKSNGVVLIDEKGDKVLLELKGE